ncbi:MAG: hypothetical protein KBB95_24395 [Deltaproteobacteria bacterium]|nr:hypothetical protein [Deltaproteobacteria bacterium]
MAGRIGASECWWWITRGLALAVFTLPVPVTAQAAVDDAQGLASSPPSAPPVPAPPDSSTAAWTLFEDALAQRADGQLGRALALLGRLRLDHPAHPAAGRALQIMSDIEAEVAARQGDTPAAQGREGTSNLARAEFVTSQALLGTTFGVVPCIIARCDGARPWVVASLGGVGLGLGFALAYSRDGITPGASYTMNSGALWGATMGYLLTGALGQFYARDDEGDDYYYYDTGFSPGDGLALGMMLGQLGGLGVGALLNTTLQPTAGEAALASSAGMWATAAMALMTFAASRWEYSDAWLRGFHAGAAMVALGGMAVGGYLGHRYDFTRGRVLLMDLGAGVGGALAVALGFVFQGNDAAGRGLMVGAAAGIVAGYGLTGYLTRGMRFTPEADVTLSVSPARGGGVVGVAGRF